MTKPKKVDRMMTEAKVLTMISRIVEMWGKSQGPCECTVHKRSGDIVDLCPDCSADCALEEISGYIAEQYESEALNGE
jgi:hypothetical protein